MGDLPGSGGRRSRLPLEAGDAGEVGFHDLSAFVELAAALLVELGTGLEGQESRLLPPRSGTTGRKLPPRGPPAAGFLSPSSLARISSLSAWLVRGTRAGPGHRSPLGPPGWLHPGRCLPVPELRRGFSSRRNQAALEMAGAKVARGQVANSPGTSQSRLTPQRASPHPRPCGAPGWLRRSREPCRPPCPPPGPGHLRPRCGERFRGRCPRPPRA